MLCSLKLLSKIQTKNLECIRMIKKFRNELDLIYNSRFTFKKIQIFL